MYLLASGLHSQRARNAMDRAKGQSGPRFGIPGKGGALTSLVPRCGIGCPDCLWWREISDVLAQPCAAVNAQRAWDPEGEPA